MAVMNVWLEMARSQFQAGDLDAALGSIDRALQVESTADAWVLKERILTEKATRGERVIGEAMGVTDHNSKLAEKWHDCGFQKAMQGDILGALKDLEKSLEFKSDNYETWSNHGSLLSALGRYEEAIESCNKAIEIKPDYYNVWTNRGSSLSSLGRYEEAIGSYGKSLELEPDQPSIWYSCANLLAALGRKDKAIASYEKSLELKPDYHEAWTNRGVSLSDLGRNEEAIESYDKALEFKFDDYNAWCNRGASLSKLGRHGEAIKPFEKAIEINSDMPEAFYNRGASLSKLGRHGEAIESCEKAIELKPDFHEAWAVHGRSLCGLGRYEEAIVSHEKAIEFKPSYHEAWHNRSITAEKSLSQMLFPLPVILNQRLANLHHKHSELSERGYSGVIASLTVGLLYCPADTHPLGHGYLQRELGDAHWKYADRTSPKPKWREALTHYEASERVLTIADHPEERLQTLQRLVRVHFALNTPTETLTALIRQGAELRDRILTQAKSQPQRDRLHRTLPNFNEFTVDLYLRQGEIIRAIETAEADKNGLMQWLLPSTETPNYHQMRQWIAHRTVVYWHFSANALTTFILNAESDRPIVLHHTNPEIALKQRNELETWIENWNKNYNTHLETSKKETNNTEKTRSEWQNTLETELEKLATILDIPTLITHLNPAKPVILIPHRDLHRLPLPSFFPDFLPTTLPSIQLGRNLRSPQTQTTHLLNIPAPSHQDTSPLPHSALESTVLAQLFQNHTVHTIDHCNLPQLQTALPNHHTHLHFNGHAYYNDQNPKQSALALSGTDRLTVADLESIDLQHYRLITLASCETALTGNQTITAEYVGLVSAFLSHRIPHILSTLWTVQSNASALLILQFYRQLLKGNPPAQSLRHSQRWLQTLTNRKLDRLYRTVLHHITSKNAPTSTESRIEAFLDQECSDLGTMEPNQKLYQDPYFWAAFILAGRH